jgi:hypothetical protein
MLLEFVRRPAGWDEMDFVKIEATVCRACNAEMATMDGIK